MPDPRLEIDVTSDASDAVRDFGAVEDAAHKMGSAVDDAGDKARAGSDKLERASEASDTLASKSSQATGGLGALSSGFALVGAEKYASGLESAAMATDFFSGVGDLANLVLQTQAVQTAKNTVLKVKDAIVTRGAAAATAVMTGAQAALNAVMAGNPIALTVLAVAALVAIFIVAYKKSETFRRIVDGAFSAVRDAAGKVVGAFRSAVGWLKDKLPAAGKVAKELVVGYIKLITLPVRVLIDVVQSLASWVRDKVPDAFQRLRDRGAAAGEFVRDKVGLVVTKAQALRDFLVDKLVGGFTTLRDKGKAAVETVLSPFEDIYDTVRDIIDLVGDLIEKIKDIDFPDLPDLNPFLKGGGTGRTLPGGGGGLGTSGGNTYYITVEGALDPYAVAVQIRDLLQREAGWSGSLVVS